MLSNLLALTIPVTAVSLLYARWEYRRHGKLTLIGLFLLCVMLFVPNLILHYATSYEMPDSLLDYAGVFVAVAGFILCLVSVVLFRSIPKMLCLDSGILTRSGLYQWSRNPQYVGWLLFLLGFALTDWSLWCFAALLVLGVSLHLLILVEEEHLTRVFGQKYVDYCQEVPRYWRLPDLFSQV